MTWYQRVAVSVLCALALGAAFAPWAAPYDPSAASGAPLLPPGVGHPLGTNDLGQDVWSQVLWGGRASLLVALVVTLLSTALSWGIGVGAGMWPRAEPLVMSVTDLLLAVPPLPLYLLVVALVGAGQVHLMLALGLLSWPAFARIVRARVIGVRGQPYVEAAHALGATRVRVALRHIAPATVELFPSNVLLTVRFAIFTEATLAFLGLGDPSTRSWGTMLGQAFGDPLTFVGGSWTWWVLPPAGAIAATVLAATVLSAESVRVGSGYARLRHVWTSVGPLDVCSTELPRSASPW
jgi:ABC-type dipeptide/oligopeptide/nickel transport system permease subunit